MTTKKYKNGCEGCKISQGFEKRVGGIIDLDGSWILNHYHGREGFLGWLVLQPRFHRMKLTDLTEDEVKALGINIQNIERALCQYWSIHSPRDPIEKVYMVYFHESEEYHLHIHLIPRSKKLGQRNPSEKAAWKICKLAPRWNGFPRQYRLRAKRSKKNEIKINKQKVVDLMAYLRDFLRKNFY